jgi:hypothetical protein
MFNATFPKGIFNNRVSTNVQTIFPVHHGIITCRASSKIRFDILRNRGQDGDFCQKQLFIKKLIAIDVVLMDYRKLPKNRKLMTVNQRRLINKINNRS